MYRSRDSYSMLAGFYGTMFSRTFHLCFSNLKMYSGLAGFRGNVPRELSVELWDKRSGVTILPATPRLRQNLLAVLFHPHEQRAGRVRKFMPRTPYEQV